MLTAIIGMAVLGAQETEYRSDAAPQTAWGDPNLQGVWEYWTFTPLERPEALADKDLLTDEEAAEVAERSRQAAINRDRVGPDDGDTGAYGQEVWTERSRATALNQASLVIDPPDGKIPAFTAAEERRIIEHRAGGGRPVRTRAGGGRNRRTRRSWASRALHCGFQYGAAIVTCGL